MDYASSVLSSTERAFSPSNSNEPTSSGGKSGLWSSRSAKCLLLGGLAASYGCSLGGLESSAGKTADVARFGNLPLSDVEIEPLGGTSRFENYSPLLRDTEAATPMSSCMQGLIAGGIGSLLVQNPLPLVIGLGECLPAVSAQQRVGNEFQVNTYTSSYQQFSSVASFGNGNFIVTWQSDGQDGSGYGVYGQLFDGNTTRIGNEFQVNTYTSNWQSNPSVESFGNGNFVVTWNSDGQDGDSGGIYGQLFDSNATRIGNEFQINAYTVGDQYYPSVANLSNGNFVVTWQSYGQDGDSGGIYGQLFDSNANRIGGEFQINTYTVDNQYHPSTTSFINGNFVVTWQSYGQDGSFDGVYGQLFDGNANRIGSEFRINTYTTEYQSDPSVASFSDGNFVVTWMSSLQDGDGEGVYGQLFDNNATGIGNEFQVNTYTSNDQNYPSVASFSNGNFVVVWVSSDQDASTGGIYGQLFYGNSTKLGNEFQVNTYTPRDQQKPSVTSFSNGNFVVTWDSSGQDGDGDGIYGQIFESPQFSTTSSTSTSSTSTSTSSSTTTSSTTTSVPATSTTTWSSWLSNTTSQSAISTSSTSENILTSSGSRITSSSNSPTSNEPTKTEIASSASRANSLLVRLISKLLLRQLD